MTSRAATYGMLTLLLGAPAAAQNGERPGAGHGTSPAAATASGPSEKTEPGAAESRQATPGDASGVKPGEEGPKGISDRANLFGDLGGLRTRLSDHGFTFGLTETSEVFGKPWKASWLEPQDTPL